MDKLNFHSELEYTRNHLIAQSIKDTSNLDQLKSEEAIRNVIESYLSKLRASDGPLTDAAKFVINSKTPISSDYFNSLFDSIYIDLSSLYNELELVDNVLSLNLQRNKNYFIVIKRKIRELWSRLYLTRTQKYGIGANESYLEPFSNDIGVDELQNAVIDRKNGYLYLDVDNTSFLNNDSLIKKIQTTTYPSHNIEDGSIHTHDLLNTFEENYENGPRDMLRKGLWKQEVIVRGLPKMIVNIGSTNSPIRKNYAGIVSIIDIEYVYPVNINRMDFDLFGKWPINIDSVLYKIKNDDDWKFLKTKGLIDLTTFNPDSAIDNTISEEKFDLCSFLNINTTLVKYLRIVLNQRNYDIIENQFTSEFDINTKINQDLSERRYEIAKLNNRSEDQPLTPLSSENESLYAQIMHVIETNNNIEQILIKIKNILQPTTNAISYNFPTTLKYILGTWSIEPKEEKYTQELGIFNSKPYKLYQKPLINVGLTVSQFLPEASTCEWYIGINNLNLPVIENNNYIRKEILKPIDLSYLGNYNDWSGTFILLNFPIDPGLSNQLRIYENGQLYNIQQYYFLNSRLVYLPYIKNINTKEYVISYPATIYDSVNVYTLIKNPNTKIEFNLAPHIVSLRYDLLNAFISEFKITLDDEQISMNTYYSITTASALNSECKLWFNTNFNKPLFLNNSVTDYYINSTDTVNNLNDLINGNYLDLIKIADSKSQLNETQIGFSSELLSLASVSPLAISREIS